MDIQRINANIKWQQLTAKEILQMRNEGHEVPNEYQKWASAVTALMNAPDDVTYEMVGGNTDLESIDKIMGVERFDIQPTDETQNNIGNENEDTEQRPIFETERSDQEKEDVTLADVKITTDPNEILKRKLRRGREEI